MTDRVPFTVDVQFEEPRPSSTRGGAGQPDCPVAIVAVAGEVDLATVGELRSILSQVISPARQEVVVDLAAVEFIDASGVGALVGAAAEASRVGVRFRLQAPSAPAERVLNLARLEGSLGPDL
jgi:anti-sigma B factor antagonist